MGKELCRYLDLHANLPGDNDLQRMQKLAMATVSYPSLRPLIPGLIRLPLDKQYDSFAQSCWKNIYDKQKREGFKKK